MRKWIKGFRKRARLRVGKLLSLKKKGALSRHRAKSVQPWRIEHYRDEIIYKQVLTPRRAAGNPIRMRDLGAFDESYINMHGYTDLKVMTVSGEFGFMITAGERPPHVTLLTGFIGPWKGIYLIIFAAKNPQGWWCADCSDRVYVAATENGWITSELKLKWIKLCENLPDYPAKTRRVLESCDGHFTNLEVDFVLHEMSFFDEDYSQPGKDMTAYPSHHTHCMATVDAEGGMFQVSKHELNKLLKDEVLTDGSIPLNRFVHCAEKALDVGFRPEIILSSLLKVGWIPKVPEQEYADFKTNSVTRDAMWDYEVDYDPIKTIKPELLKSAAPDPTAVGDDGEYPEPTGAASTTDAYLHSLSRTEVLRVAAAAVTEAGKPRAALLTDVPDELKNLDGVGDVDGWDLFDKTDAELRAEVTRVRRLAAMQARGPCLGAELNFKHRQLIVSPQALRRASCVGRRRAAN